MLPPRSQEKSKTRAQRSVVDGSSAEFYFGNEHSGWYFDQCMLTPICALLWTCSKQVLRRLWTATSTMQRSNLILPMNTVIFVRKCLLRHWRRLVLRGGQSAPYSHHIDKQKCQESRERCAMLQLLLQRRGGIKLTSPGFKTFVFRVRTLSQKQFVQCCGQSWVVRMVNWCWRWRATQSVFLPW